MIELQAKHKLVDMDKVFGVDENIVLEIEKVRAAD